ncbi:hypothetical protein RDI58_009614 [Solanum bulbocastanum]|uniref:Uncharacterized protein n=1 Tax=Solanum bulbocastanum TaxID=147425 RepID=A0AAN8TL79_SOLBU
MKTPALLSNFPTAYISQWLQGLTLALLLLEPQLTRELKWKTLTLPLPESLIIGRKLHD